MHSLGLPSFLFTKNTGAPHGELLSQINQATSSSSNRAFVSFNSIGAFRYGAFEIGVVPGMWSSENSASLDGGSPANSIRKTSKIFVMIGMEDLSFSLDLDSTRLVTKARQPYKFMK